VQAELDLYDGDGIARFGEAWPTIKRAMAPAYAVGDVAAIRGEPPVGNPYLGNSLLGEERAMALRGFRDGEAVAGVSFWFAPTGGGDRRRESAAAVDWSHL
jgi:hypothetical protein